MSLDSGTRLGPFEILSVIGAGGMGEVYKAKDTRLERTVAIKILPSHLSQNPQLKQRFEREARAISSLSHSNICSLYDIGNQDGIDYIVMEYLEGDTLSRRFLYPTVISSFMENQMVWLDRTGKELGKLGQPGTFKSGYRYRRDLVSRRHKIDLQLQSKWSVRSV